MKKNLKEICVSINSKISERAKQRQEFSSKCLNEAGVATIPGTAFGKYATDHVRFNFATSRENISKALEKIDKMLH